MLETITHDQAHAPLQEGLLDQIQTIKTQKHALILAHNYQSPEVQDMADIVGDSLMLARYAQTSDNPIIVMCGVFFMAETAAILNPHRKVLIPDMHAGCPLANFASPKKVKEWRARYPEHAFVAYVNSSAAVKAESDIICTSSNAVRVVESLPQEKIVFLPDENLARFVRQRTQKEILAWPGHCHVHHFAPLELYADLREQHPDAFFIAHPECPEEILEMADALGSTSHMAVIVAEHPEISHFIIATEWGVRYALSRKFPDKIFLGPPEMRMNCNNMKKITLPKILQTLQTEDNQVHVPEDIRIRALKPLERMLALP